MVRRSYRKSTRQQERACLDFENEQTVEIIPTKIEFNDEVKKKLCVAAYCRMSTFYES